MCVFMFSWIPMARAGMIFVEPALAVGLFVSDRPFEDRLHFGSKAPNRPTNGGCRRNRNRDLDHFLPRDALRGLRATESRPDSAPDLSKRPRGVCVAVPSVFDLTFLWFRFFKRSNRIGGVPSRDLRFNSAARRLPVSKVTACTLPLRFIVSPQRIRRFSVESCSRVNLT